MVPATGCAATCCDSSGGVGLLLLDRDNRVTTTAGFLVLVGAVVFLGVRVAEWWMRHFIVTNRRVLLTRRPAGIPQPEDFSLDAVAVPEPGPLALAVAGLAALAGRRWRAAG